MPDQIDPNLLSFSNSSNIRKAKFEPANGQVTVEFANGQTYVYSGLTAEMMKDWSSAKSPGGWFNSNIKAHPEKFVQLGVVKPGDEAPRGETIAPPMGANADHANDGGGAPPITDSGTPVRSSPAPAAADGAPAPSTLADTAPVKKPGMVNKYFDRPWKRGVNGTTS